MPPFTTEADAVTYIFRSMRKLRGHDQRGTDDQVRDVTPTRRLLAAQNLLDTPREYAVITGSKGKGSTTILTSRILQSLGHRVGTITSPHLVSWRERIRVDGVAIPEADLVRIVNDLAPSIDAIEETLGAERYFSPQGIFLAVALRWFDEQGVQAAVLEVGRGGRFDDIAVVPNKLALFSPIMLEHPQQLGPTIERIAWHKAGIIKAYGHAYSVPQAPEVMAVLQAEADALDAEFNWIAPKDMGHYLFTDTDGMHLDMGRYGEVIVALTGRYQIENVSLAVTGAGNMHARLPGVSHGSPEYVERVRHGLATVRWPGRCQKLQDAPLVYVDGAINTDSAQLFVESVREVLRPPVVSIMCVPSDKDYPGVYAALGAVSQTVLLTETTRNPSLTFPTQANAEAVAALSCADVRFNPSLAPSVETALKLVGDAGTLLIVGTQSIVAETMQLWNLSFETL